jgi:hypothetical protein
MVGIDSSDEICDEGTVTIVERETETANEVSIFSDHSLSDASDKVAVPTILSMLINKARNTFIIL